MATIRLWHQSMTELAGLKNYEESLKRHFERTNDANMTIDVHGLRTGTYLGRPPTVALANPYVYHRCLEQIVANALMAEGDGYDAFIVGSFSEPYLTELRSVLRIPVASILESSMLVACSLGHTAVAIANAPEIAVLVRKATQWHALGGRIREIISLDPPWHEPDLAAAFDDPTVLRERFCATAAECVKHGAEVIIPAEGVLASFLSQQGVTDVQGAPVLDVFAIAWAYAAMMVHLRVQAKIEVARTGLFAQPDPDLVAQVSQAQISGSTSDG